MPNTYIYMTKTCQQQQKQAHQEITEKCGKKSVEQHQQHANTHRKKRQKLVSQQPKSPTAFVHILKLPEHIRDILTAKNVYGLLLFYLCEGN